MESLDRSKRLVERAKEQIAASRGLRRESHDLIDDSRQRRATPCVGFPSSSASE